jgi:hypothetical protein
MDKNYLEPIELINIATDHVYCAEHLLKNNAEIPIDGSTTTDSLSSFVTLMYMAFELTLKAYLAQGSNANNQHRNLSELIELSNELGLSSQDIQLLKKLTKQYAFRKGVDYLLWDNRQELQVFCAEIIELYERLQQLMPIELHPDYL